MSSFMKKGKRNSLHADRVKLTKHVAGFYKIMHQMDNVAQLIHENEVDIEFTENNIAELASKYTNLPIDRMEANVLLNKLYNLDNTNHNED